MNIPKAGKTTNTNLPGDVSTLSRRGFVKSGVLGGAGFCLADLLRHDACRAAAGKEIRQRNSLIILWMRGGPSQHETWDPKIDAPSEYRGAFSSTPTSVPGIHICDLLPLSAAMMDKWSIIRSLHHHDAGHSNGDQICFTGYNPGPDPNVNIHPSCGSIVSKQLGSEVPELPSYVMIPRQVPGTDAAYLGASFRPFETISDPANDGPFQVKSFEIPKGLDFKRLAGRRQLLGSLDQVRREIDQGGTMAAMDRFQQQAWEIISGPKARDAFNLDAEPRTVRERYGFIPAFKAPTPDRCGVPAWSQRFLLARRLVEAGVRLVTVDCRWWDTHVQGVESMREGFLPRWDQAYSALIEDLHTRGLLDTTMVLAWGEFGRTPKMNAKAGRDHWPNVFSAAMAGGGIQGGRVVGESDSKGGVPNRNAKSPQDVLATIYRHLGVNTTMSYTDNNGRPHPVLMHGEAIRELF